MLASASVIDDWCYVSKHIEDVQVSARRYSEIGQSPIFFEICSIVTYGTLLLKGSKLS